MYIIMLSGQGSNLESSDPESDVLPIPPPDKNAKIKIKYLLYA